MKFLKKENQIICNWNNWEFCFRKNSLLFRTETWLLTFYSRDSLQFDSIVTCHLEFTFNNASKNFIRTILYLFRFVDKRRAKAKKDPSWTESSRLGINISWSTSESLALNIYDKISKYLQCSAKRTLVSLIRLLYTYNILYNRYIIQSFTKRKKINK